MLNQISGLHHVTSMAKDPNENNAFFTKAMGLRRVKKTVNFDSPDTYHLYYGDENGSPGTIITYFPFAHIARGKSGSGEVGTTAFSVPTGALDFWSNRLPGFGATDVKKIEGFGEKRLTFAGPDGDGFALVEVADDHRAPWRHDGIDPDHAVRGFHSVSMRLRDIGATSELLRFMGYEEVDRKEGITRLAVPGGNGAGIIDLEAKPLLEAARLGAGSVHHVAFAVENRAKQLEVRKALMDTGYQVTPVIDRDYFWAIYFRTPGGVLFEVATNEPGFDRDEDTAHLGEALKLPEQHSGLRAEIERYLPPIVD
ncbi:ring-cleaving dioxygenase [Rhizobium sp. BK176]|uniref:ring-cleaving dioxygenase n=1 Tax=Rhizobium sp. BK176 TaxID=2587071 RepID=UPI002168B378|nr:ring-cleaving dioxygenase [Rhizobium sp. BK176]MCS4088930.1 glyoxalase family protein [Rhizobium sp. BK176]